MTPDTLIRYGALPEDWHRFDHLGISTDLLPVVSNPRAPISPDSAMKQLGKTPSRYTKDRQVVGISRWTEHQASDAEIKRWAKEPDYGICVQTRYLRAIDIDVEDTSTSNAIVLAVEKFLGFSLPKRSRADSGKCLLRFALEGQFPKRIMHLEGGIVEFLGNGQQFIAFGTHPKGARYEWSRDEADHLLDADQFEALWQHLADMFAVEPPREMRTTERRRGEDLDVEDPIADWLEAEGLVLDTDARGALLIECPWADEHSSGDAGDTSTVWFRAGTNGHSTGHFKCLHAHCAHRTRSDYLEAIGHVEDVANDFEDLGPLPDEAGRGAGGDDEVGEGASADARQPGFEVIPAGEFSRRQPPEWIVKGVLPRADLAVVYGESGSGKSFVMIDIAMAIARGVPWRGLKVKQGRVVYIAAEGGGGFRNRLVAYAQQHEVKLDDIPFGVIHATPNFLEKTDIKALAKAIRAGGPVSIIVTDTYAQVTAGANENSGEDMGLALRNARRLSDACQAMMVLVHHSGKDASKGARGWSGIRAAADAELEVTKGPTGRALRTTKQKDGDDEAAWGFTLEKIMIGVDEDGDGIDSCVVLEAEVPARDAGGRQQAKKPLREWEKAVLEAHAELALGGDVLRSDLIELAASKRPDVGTLRDRKKNVAKVIERLSSGVNSILIAEKNENHVSLRT